MAIPFRTLRYPSATSQNWGINFQRNIRRRNERAYWAPIPRQFNLYRLSLAGSIGGVQTPALRNLRITPFALGNQLASGEVPVDAETDFDFGGDLFAGRTVKIVDCGDVAMLPGQYEANLHKTTAAIATILQRGAIPIVLGGDHAIPVPVMRAYEGFGSMCVVQLDAHLDWRDEINGVRDGLSSQMRRASEMPWVSGSAQIGLRGLGSGRHQEYADARAYGSVLIGADELHRVGVDDVLARIPAADRYYITFDADGLDPTIAPGVGGPGPGGITYYEAFHLLRGIAAKGKGVGLDFVEVVPSLDVADATSIVAARLILNYIGALAHTGQIGTP
jgi:agmatinase